MELCMKCSDTHSPNTPCKNADASESALSDLLDNREHGMKIKELRHIIKKIETKKKVMANNRDEIRQMYDDIGGLLESFDAGIEGLDEGILNITNAIDSISEVV